uniref:Peptidase A1 domain-containing protein n=1 Tax=Cucumis melo TaxID=3656 RepID=A0A9I9CWH3_CUCME
MRAFSSLILALASVVLPATVVYCGFPVPLLSLYRAVPSSSPVQLETLRARDRLRHARILQGVVDFSVEGSSDPLLVGLYFTKVKLGTPPMEFTVQIDTGSDILWVNCNSCNGCPRSSGLGIQLNFFDASSSSSSSLVSCSDPICNSAFQTTATQCLTQSNQCSYTFQYGDGSGTSGYYVSESMYFDMVMGHSMIANSSASVVFGCSTYQSGDLTKSDHAIDGIFGFGPGDLSVISQLSARGITPKGEGNGGGILVLGEVLEPGIVYSPLVPSQSLLPAISKTQGIQISKITEQEFFCSYIFTDGKYELSSTNKQDNKNRKYNKEYRLSKFEIAKPHYNLYLQSITVNGQTLPIDPSVFATSINRGTIIDSGTTLAYLVEEAYTPFVSAITAAVSQSVTPTISKGNQCYLVSTSVGEIFPLVSLNFAGSASMVLKPEEYLMHLGFYDGAALWCIGFQKVQEGVTILGGSQAVNVSVTSGKNEFVNAGQLSVSSSSRDKLLQSLTMEAVAVLTSLILFIHSQLLEREVQGDWLLISDVKRIKFL